jgi:hypothetical protein
MSDIVDVISKEDACEKRYKNNKKSLNVVNSMKVSKAYGEEDGCSEVIAPNILLVPWAVRYS